MFAATVGLSAFLLFLVQPVLAKQILPWFGGSAAVWTTCMVFFQLVLLAGYFYSDRVVRRLTPRRQALVHAALLIASLAFLPVTPSEAFKPPDAEQPIARILVLLAATIGLPYLMLSTTGPLVQAWYARQHAGTAAAGAVWRLYALSNAASMLALIAYPPLIEPAASQRLQSVGWSVGYALFVGLALASAWRAARLPAAQAVEVARTVDAAQAAEAAPSAEPARIVEAAPMPTEAPPAVVANPPIELHATWSRQLLWLALAALASVLLLTITTHITQNVASVPFLWVLPLALYLASFILAFDGRGWYWRRSYQALAALLAAAMMGALLWRVKAGWDIEEGFGTLFEEGVLPIQWAVPLYAAGLFVLCMFCHGELVQRKPAATQLTRFYLMVALGGATGGLLVGIVAPVALAWTWELPAALLVAPLLVLLLGARWIKPFALAALVGSGWFGWKYVEHVRDTTIEISRNFYGTLRVKATAPDGTPGAAWRMMHGVIMHGEQARELPASREPGTYYGPDSGVGVAIAELRALEPNEPLRLGLVGLGVGTLAAWGQPGDEFRFYELNPAVLELAERRFTYLKDSAARVHTVLGDARLVLEREAPQRFHLLAIDAFSSDSIPVHLLTREAMAVYRRHLREGGVVALHLTNRYLDLMPVARQLAEGAGLSAWLVTDKGDDVRTYWSDWVLITGNTALLEALAQHGRGAALQAAAMRRPWTDDHNNLFEVLK